MVRHQFVVAGALALIGCAGSGQLDESDELEDTGEASDAITYVTPVKWMPAASYLNGYESPAGTAHLLVAGAFNSLIGWPNRYVILTRNKASPYLLTLHYIRAQPTDPLVGQKVDSVQTSLVGVQLDDAISVKASGSVDYATFAYQGMPASIDPLDPVGFDSVHLLRANATSNLGHTDYIVRNCKDVTGFLVCRTNAPAIAASTRGSSDKVLVSYLVQETLATNHSVLGASLFNPSLGTITTLPNQSACTTPPCTVSAWHPQVQTAYNRQADKFLTVVQLSNAPDPIRMRGQIYDGTTGAAGPSFDFGSHFHSQMLGIASNPNASANPNMHWIVLTQKSAYSVAPNGSFTQVAPPYPGDPTWGSPDHLEGQWTLQWADSEGSYEWLSKDFSTPSSPLNLRKFHLPTNSWLSFDISSGQTKAYTESISFATRTNNEIAVWSAPDCTGGGSPCPAGIYWRLMQRN